MRLILAIFMTALLFSCTEEKQSIQDSDTKLTIEGDYDNFLQYWKENTAEEIHRDKSGGKHDHIHIKFIKDDQMEDAYKLEFYTDRNNVTKIGEKEIQISSNPSNQEDKIILKKIGNKYTSGDGQLAISGDTIWTNGLGILPDQPDLPYKLIRCRYFAGWVEVPLPSNPDSTYRVKNQKIHDQGGMAELEVEGLTYTAELTQLNFAHIISIMKLAIYDTPMSEVGINSRSVSYTWTNPEAQRLGINIRKVVSGWTLIEEGFVNSDNMAEDKK